MKRYLIPIVLAGIFLGCDSDTLSVTDSGVDDPYVLGNYWVYDRTEFDTNGTIISKAQDTLSVTTEINNQFTLNDGEPYDKDSLGIFYDCYLWYKFPASVGDTMFLSTELLMKGTGRIFPGRIRGMVADVGVPVSTHAGVFIAYKYYHDFITRDGMVAARYITYFTPSIGSIREELYEVGSSFQPPLILLRVRELLKYKVR